MTLRNDLKQRSRQIQEQSRAVQRGQKWWLIALVWLLRVAVGATFIVSGVAKAIDPWGSIYKFEEYFTLWGWDIPRSLTLAGAVGLSVVEALTGLMLLLGCYRRWSVWILAAVMAFMLPLSLYIYIDSPVADCGCFGDFLIISNAATFWKNVVLTAALVFLILYNRRVLCLVSPYFQWMPLVTGLAYLLIINVIGYNVQPMVDFRAWPVGTPLVATADEEGDEPEFLFIYEKDGEERKFTADSLPDETWTFVDRQQIGETPVANADDFTVYEGGDDVTDDAIATEGPQLLVLIPDMRRVDISFTSYINALGRYLEERGGSVIGVIGGEERDLDFWRDIALAEYPLYTAEPTQIKALARGNVALVYLNDGVVQWKRTASSIDGEEMLEMLKTQPLDALATHGGAVFRWLIGALVFILLAIVVVNNLGRLAIRITRRNIRKNKRTNKPKQLKMRKKIVAGNWKMNTTVAEGVGLAKDVNEALSRVNAKCDVIIAVPFTHLAPVAAVIDQNRLGLGAENCADHAKGAYTGEVSAAMVASTGATYVILGHSERRQYYGETSETLREKVAQAFANNLTPIFCIGEVLEERENGTYFDVVKGQIESALFDLSAEDFSKIILAYEPVWAIGTGKTATDDQAQEMHAYIRKTIADKYGKEVADNTSILYGGSCKPSNAAALFAKEDVDGGLIGGASLDAESFMGIVNAW